MVRALVATAVAALVVLLPSSPASADGEVFRFTDPAIVESSSLVDLGGTVVTANDSGHAADLYSVDTRTGRTVGTTYLHVPAQDVEALAPAGGSRVWVGDIGDNLHRRRHVDVYLAPVARRRLDVRPTAYHLVYPDGAHDAESLFTDRSGRLYVVTKGFTGGAVYRAPARLAAGVGNRLERMASVPDFATDAAMLPDGAHVLIRSYGLAAVYTFPGLERLGSFPLPAQRQGEGISVGAGGRILLGSEGLHAPVLQVSLPADLRAAVAGDTPSQTPSTTPSTTPSQTPSPSPQPEPTTSSGSSTWLLWLAPGVILLGALGIGLGLRRRRQ